MCSPVRAGTHRSKAHFGSHPLCDENRRATYISRVTVHPQQSTAPPANLGTKQHILVKRLWLSWCLPSLSLPINHFWQVAGKQLLMIVLLQSAGSHLLTLPAVVCLPERDKRTDVDNMPAVGKIRSKLSRESDVVPCWQSITLKKHLLALDACWDSFSSSLKMFVLIFSSFTLKIQGSIPKTILSLLLLHW